MIAPILNIPSFIQPDIPPLSEFDALTPKPIAINASPDRQQKQPVPICRRDDSCEIRLTSAKLELARLRSLLLDAIQCCEQKDQAEDCDPPPTPPAAATFARRAYAPPPLGEPNEHRESLPPLQLDPLLMTQQVSNLGTLVDVLL